MKLAKIKKLLLTTVLGIAAVAFTGCGEAVKTDIAFNADNTVNYSMSTGFDLDTWTIMASMSDTTVDEMVKQLEAQGATVSDEVIDGVTYKMVTESKSNVAVSSAEAALGQMYSDVCMTSDYLYAVFDPDKTSTGYDDMMSQLSTANDNYDDSMEMSVYQTFSMTFNAPVTNTTGTIDPANPNHVTWVNTDATKKMTFFATTATVTSTAKTDSVKNNKYYKSNKTIKVKNAENMVKMTIAKKSSVDGTALNPKSIKSGYVVKANASYELKIWSKDGKCQTVTFTVDKKKPTISGAKNGKTYKKVTLKFKDNLSGIKSVTVNGKKISANKYNGYTIKKAGKYKIVVTDKAGNKTTMTIKIKK